MKESRKYVFFIVGKIMESNYLFMREVKIFDVVYILD